MALEFGSYLNQEQPQQNQFLQGNPATQPNAQTSWMNPDTSDWAKYSGDISGGLNRPPQQNTPPANGTALGAISAGQVGQYMPGGYDAGKFGDQSHNTPKYAIGRILSKYPPGPAGFAAAQAELMATGLISGFDKDGLTLNDKSGYGGHRIDIGNSFSDPNAQHGWQWLDQFQDPSASQGSFMGQGNQQNSFMQMLMQMLQQGNNSGFRFNPQQGRAPGQQFNPQGGFIPPPTGGFNNNPNTGVAGGIDRGQPVFDPSANRSYLGGVQTPNQDPYEVLRQMWAGTYKDPRAGMPQ